jgi:tetratricopeptide (TPR) repeat protein
MLPKERASSTIKDISEAETKLDLQLARLLNFLGASNYALRMIDRIRTENRARSKVEIAEIYFCNFKFKELLELLGENLPLPKSEPWHQDWLLHFYLAIAFGELGRPDLAIARLEGIRALSASPLIQAMTYSYQGKFLLIGREPGKALVSLLKAQQFFRANDQTEDQANFHSFLGECYLKLGKFSDAQTELKKAFSVFHRSGVRPEEWIETVLLLEQIPKYRDETQKLAPRLQAMFGPDYPLLRAVRFNNSEKDSHIFSISKIELSRKSRHLDRASDTAWNKKKARLGLDLIDELISNLVYAGEYGLPQFRLYELLWPNEPFSFDQHQKRLERVVGRARAQGYKISWKDLHLRLLSKDVTVSSRPEKVVRGCSFLKEHSSFRRSDVQKYFAISQASAAVLCRDWLKAGLTRSSKNSSYIAAIF